MNQDQKLFVRITHAGTQSEQLEVVDFRAALKAIYDSFADHNARKVLMTIELSNQPFLNRSLLSREQQLEQDVLNQALINKDEVIYPPDVTLGECEEAWASPEGQAMFKYQRAENRIGVDPETLRRIELDYFHNYPRVAPHGPKWTNT